jgi:uncharacterized ferritin-like protein (DUF455 family)
VRTGLHARRAEQSDSLGGHRKWRADTKRCEATVNADQTRKVPSGLESGTLERWAYDYLTSTSLVHKLSLAPAPDAVCSSRLTACPELRPGRPPELATTWDKYKAPKSAAALREPARRAHLLHTFLHHELQAAELMCWAILAFPDTPASFKKGLASICLDEIRHMRAYQAHIERLGFSTGAFGVRDWFWERAPSAPSALSFVALMGIGFEGGNLDHTQRFARMFREAGDERGAVLQEVVGGEEERHVAFAAHWFRNFAGALDFARWCAALPPPLSPMVMRGQPLARSARMRAGLDAEFLDELEAWQPESRGS